VPFVPFLGSLLRACCEPGDAASAVNAERVRRVVRLACAAVWLLADRWEPVGVTDGVVHLCSSLARQCGIAVYTRALCGAQGMRCVATLAEIGPQPPRILHLQHEFGLYPLDHLAAVVRYCRRHAVRLVVTMHTVVPRLPLAARVRAVSEWGAAKARRLVPAAASERPTGAGRTREPAASGPCAGLAEWRAPGEFTLFVLRSTRLILRAAEAVFVHSDEARRQLARNGARHVEVVTMGVADHPVSPTLRSRHDGRLHVGCHGFLNPTRCVVELIAACELVGDVRLHLMMCTGGVLAPGGYELEVRDALRGRPWVALDDRYLPLAEVTLELSRCDVNAYLSTRNNHVSTSAALGPYLAARRPIVASDALRVEHVRHLPRLIDRNDPETIAAALRTINPDTSALEAYVATHGWAQAIQPYDG
jgi:hypothetical protein